MTPKQIRTLQTARRTLDLSEPQYRMILKNTGGVASSKQLTHQGFEQVMAVMEEMGFQQPGNPTYWRDKSRGGGTRESLTSAERMRFKVEALARQCPTYPLGAMVRRTAGGRTDVLAELTNQELWNLIEAYKGIAQRHARAARQGTLFPPLATGNSQRATAHEPTGPAEGSAGPAVTEGPARTPATATDGDRRQGRDATQPAKPPARARKTAATKGPRDPVSDDEIPF